MTAILTDALAVPPPDFKIMTFNIRNEGQDADQYSWDYRGPDVIALINRQMPDVVGLQESSGGFQCQDLADGVEGMQMLEIPGHRQARRNSVLYRSARLAVAQAGSFWLSGTPDSFSTTWGNTYPRSVTWVRFLDRSTQGHFYLFNLHLDHESADAKKRGVRLLLDRIAARQHPDPFLITGDFNSAEDSDIVRYLTGQAPLAVEGAQPPAMIEQPLLDTYRAIHKDGGTADTVKPFGKPFRGQKIDYIFAAPSGVSAIDSAIVADNREGYYPSDHLPVVARVRLND